MSLIYAMSDIHGFYDVFKKNLELINLSQNDAKLILCGDYIDYGPKSYETLELVKSLTEKYPDRVVALMGNHETMFLDFLKNFDDYESVEWLTTDKDFLTVKGFISFDIEKTLREIKADSKADLFTKLADLVRKDITENHSGLIEWLRALPYFYETDKQIFVHAGIDEEAGEFWKYGTPDEYFVGKYPAKLGGFIKDIVAGHIATSTIAHDQSFHDVFYDKKSHYYIDGSVNVSGKIPILMFDTENGSYKSL